MEKVPVESSFWRFVGVAAVKGKIVFWMICLNWRSLHFAQRVSAGFRKGCILMSVLVI